MNNKDYLDLDEILKMYENDDIWKTTWRTTKTSVQKTNEEILEEMDIAEIEKFLRKKKLERLGSK